MVCMKWPSTNRSHLYEEKVYRQTRSFSWQKLFTPSILACALLLTTIHLVRRKSSRQGEQLLKDFRHEALVEQGQGIQDIAVLSPLDTDDWAMGNHGSFIGTNGSPYLQHLDSGMGTVTAILPVTAASIGNLQAITEPLLGEESSISTIILVCPAELLSSLNTLFLGESTSPFLDISVSIWPDGVQEATAILSAASRVNADYVLLLGSNGLYGLDAELQLHLLSHPVLVDLPMGLCGIRSSGGGEAGDKCISPTRDAQPVSFLVPPMVLLTAALHGYNASSGHAVDVWKDLGGYFHSDESVGGYVQSGFMVNSGWCSSLCDALLGNPSSGTQQALVAPVKTEESFSPSSIAIILPTVQSLEEFSPAVCRLQRRGVQIHVLVLSHNAHHFPPRNSSYPWLHDNLVSKKCQIPYSALHESQIEFANAEATEYWLDNASTSYSSILIAVANKQISTLDVDLEKRREAGTTLIRIPVQDLRYCDWIGALSELEIANWHVPEVSISVITDQRPTSLSRLLNSLEVAHYFGDKLDLRINMEHSADRKTHEIVKNLAWRQGSTFVHQRIVHGDLLPAVVESWFPHSNDSYGVILEDDVEVSPFFYAWVKFAILRYRYGAAKNSEASMFGISLYQQKNLELHLDGRKLFDARSLFESSGLPFSNTPFLSQIPCSWGAVYFPEHWAEFHSFLRTRLDEKWIPLREDVVPDVRSNKWTRSWKRYFIELVYLRGYLMLYPNYREFVSLSTNHLEVGSHVKDQPRNIYEHKKRLFTLPLMQPPDVDNTGSSVETGLLDLPEEQLPDWSDLPVLDLLGTITTSEEITGRGITRQTEVADCITVASEAGRQMAFDARELFACGGGEDYDVFEDLDAVHYDF